MLDSLYAVAVIAVSIIAAATIVILRRQKKKIHAFHFFLAHDSLKLGFLSFQFHHLSFSKSGFSFSAK